MENYEQIISDIESEMNKKSDEPRFQQFCIWLREYLLQILQS
jgi:hypothetical protein